METFPKFAPFSLEDKQIVDSFLRNEQPQISEMTFANMYSWRRTEVVEVASVERSLILRGRRVGGEVIYSPPIGECDKVQMVRMMTELALKEDAQFVMKGITEPLASRLTSEKFKLLPDRDNWDYVYLTADLASLPGPKFHSKRKDIKKFQSKHKHEYRRISTENVQECIKFQEEWCLARNCNESQSLTEENLAILEALQNFGKLGLSGAAVLVGGQVAGFTIGERLNEDTWVTHFEKASPDYPGLYQYINQQLALEIMQSFQFVNREQDLGEEGLRAAKMSYHPHHLVEKSLQRVERI